MACLTQDKIGTAMEALRAKRTVLAVHLFVLCVPPLLQSLTFSTSEESRLFEWMPVDSAHSGLEHTLTGTVLFRSPQQQEEHHRAAAALVSQLEPGGSSTPCQVCVCLHRPCRRGVVWLVPDS
jgi:hypothetical protein